MENYSFFIGGRHMLKVRFEYDLPEYDPSKHDPDKVFGF